MDGMDYDTWDAVVRPLLTEHFQVVSGQDRTYFSLLPSKTDVRVGACSPRLSAKTGRTFRAIRPKMKGSWRLALLGVAKHECDGKVRFVTDAETSEAPHKLGYSQDDLRDINILIYPISDDLGHYHNDTLAALNEKVQ